MKEFYKLVKKITKIKGGGDPIKGISIGEEIV